MRTTIYFIRHAQNHPSSDQHYSQWPLSLLGQDQATQLVPILSGLGLKKIYSSPYVRCLETIRPFIEQDKLEVILYQDLEERLVAKNLIRNFPEVWEKSWEDFDFALPECESSREAQLRFCSAIRSIVEENRGSTIGISSHGYVIALFLNYLDPSYLRTHAEQIRNPDLIRVFIEDDFHQWDRDFSLEELNGFATYHGATPIRFADSHLSDTPTKFSDLAKNL